uniref:Ribosomal protein L2 n=1 Tax=Romanomermis culicivorax TaxID=13658 RepID=A0A915HJN3_ROMCU
MPTILPPLDDNPLKRRSFVRSKNQRLSLGDVNSKKNLSVGQGNSRRYWSTRHAVKGCCVQQSTNAFPPTLVLRLDQQSCQNGQQSITLGAIACNRGDIYFLLETTAPLPNKLNTTDKKGPYLPPVRRTYNSTNVHVRGFHSNRS